jgi:small subunit ribosomal protein S12
VRTCTEARVCLLMHTDLCDKKGDISMPTINQLIRKGRGEKRRGTPVISLSGSPQKKATCLRVYTSNPRKPNSAVRKVARVRLTSGIEATVYIPGIGHSLQEHSQVLLEGGAPADLPGVAFTVVRGVYDSTPVAKRMNGRSRYGVKKPKAGAKVVAKGGK